MRCWVNAGPSRSSRRRRTGWTGSVLALIKAATGNVSLSSMLTEVSRLEAVRAVGLPVGLFADVAPKVLI